MATSKTIEDLRAEIKELSKNYFSDSNVVNNIDHFDIPLEGWGEKLTNFWNESVSTCLDDLKKKFDFSDEELKRLINDAAQNFWNNGVVWENTNPVYPFKNNEGINYLEARTDEIGEVLNNRDNLNFTRNRDNPTSIVPDGFKFLTRLIMPMSKRGVEVEDLNRNFWVIGQNLDFLNNFWVIEFNGLMNDFIAELMGIWNNIYKLWEALIELDSLLTNHVSYEKVRVVIDWTKSLSSNIDYEQMIGIEGATGADENDGTLIQYFNINKYIDNIFKENGEYLSQLSLLEKMQPNSGSFIRLDLEYTSRPLKDVLDMVKTYNFYVVGKKNIYDVLSLRISNSSRLEYDEKDNSDNRYLDLPNLYREPISDSNYKLWIDFINESEENGSSNNKLCTISEIDLVSYAPHASWGLDYDVNISIPSGDIVDENNDYKYEDIVRINKPFANLNKISYKDISSHIASLNNKDNLFTYTITEEQGGVFVGQTIFLDGFFPYVPFMNELESSYFETTSPDYFVCNNGAKHYTWATVNGKFVLSYLSDIVQNPYNGTTCYTPLLRERQFASSDMISHEHDVEGQTKKDNKYVKLNSPAYNLRYINGRGKNQQMEVVTTKDQSRIIKKINPTISLDTVSMGQLYNLANLEEGGNWDGMPDEAFYFGLLSVEEGKFPERYECIDSEGNMVKCGGADDNCPAYREASTSRRVYIPISEIKDTTEGINNSLDIKKIWNKYNNIIVPYLKNKYKNMENYSSQFILLGYGSYLAGASSTVGTRWGQIIELYREENNIECVKIGELDLGECFFTGSNMAALEEEINGKLYIPITAYTQKMLGGQWSRTITATLEIKDHNTFPLFRGQWNAILNMKITANSLTTMSMKGVISNDNFSYEISELETNPIGGYVKNETEYIPILATDTDKNSLYGGYVTTKYDENLGKDVVDYNSYSYAVIAELKDENGRFYAPWGNPQYTGRAGWKEWGSEDYDPYTKR